MSSWRSQTSQEVQEDLDGLFDASLPFAQQMLDKHGEFLPFGAAVGSDGEVTMIAGDPGQGERPQSTEVYATIVEGMKAKSERFRAVAIVTDVRLRQSDAIRVELEHREGTAIAVFLPYTKKRAGAGVDYADLMAGEGERRVWPAN